MLLKPDKPVTLTTSYRPISLISSIMKLFERVIEQRLRSHLEDIGFINKHQSGFRRAKSTDDHQGDHTPGKHGKLREFVKLLKSQGKLREILIFVEKTWKTQGKSRIWDMIANKNTFR